MINRRMSTVGSNSNFHLVDISRWQYNWPVTVHKRDTHNNIMHLCCVHLFSFILFHQEEEAALKHRDRLEQEKRCLIREMKRCRDEDASPFNHFPILNKRYALLNLLGKGGFSEVFKVYPFTPYHLLSSFQYNSSMPRSYLKFFSSRNIPYPTKPIY